MAHAKSGGTTKLGRDSESKRLGVKLSSGQLAIPGNIIIRQRGSKYLAGQGVKMGKDDTIFAITNGIVKFTTRKKKNFNGSRRLVKTVHVV
ncbi:MAG: 50S ribosomal protein L27 [Patescibacteria group bacterium]